MPFRWSSRGNTHVGNVRKQNEDSFLVDDALGLFIVADGMGGHAGGDVASAEAIEQVMAMVRGGNEAVQALRALPSEANRRTVRRLVESAIQAATYMVFGIAEQDPARKGMGTTISTLSLCGDVAVVGQVGDSRVYLVRDGVASQLTEDHTLVNLQVKAGALTREQAKTVSYQNLITRAVGVKDYVEVDTFEVDLRAGDRFLLCSDGVHGYLDSDDEVNALCGLASPAEVAEALIQHALKQGGRDNATALVVDILPGGSG